ncbi:hypothetical protein [Vibrio maerlii]|uniref:hypothetical protein n=1 Tax=Vibrio maerlii TaxID=2231648 RepID=UPI0013DFD456|nr:hypothetical protein [Vibrio maerlii]
MSQHQFELLQQQLEQLSPSQLKALSDQINASIEEKTPEKQDILTDEERDAISKLFL